MNEWMNIFFRKGNKFLKCSYKTDIGNVPTDFIVSSKHTHWELILTSVPSFMATQTVKNTFCFFLKHN